MEQSSAAGAQPTGSLAWVRNGSSPDDFARVHELTAILDLVTGRWRSQALYAGVALGIYDALSASRSSPVKNVAVEIGADEALLYRLMRASAGLGLLVEEEARFRLSGAGQLLRSDHPQSLRSMALLEEGPELYSAWRHLPALVRDGEHDGFKREFGRGIFDHARESPAFGKVFQNAMTSYSTTEAEAVRAGLEGRHAGPKLFCDIGGGRGYLLAALLRDRPEAKGVVFDLPEVTAASDAGITGKDGLAGRISHRGGDFFDAVPEADIYLMKHILHDWNDDECRRILRVVRKSAREGARLLVIEWVVPSSSEPHFAKLFDIHMLCVSTGRQRTRAEFETIGADSGWHVADVRDVPESPLAIVELAPVWRSSRTGGRS
ncbi:methyltransferase [Pseudochelatococcus sp. B33]